jgi:hypothetical protein
MKKREKKKCYESIILTLDIILETFNPIFGANIALELLLSEA